MKRFFVLVLLSGMLVVFFACASAPRTPAFSTFENYPSEDNTLVFFTVMSGQGVYQAIMCIITNPDDLIEVAALEYNNVTNGNSLLSIWQDRYNAVIMRSDMSVLRTDVSMFDLPKEIGNVGILLVGLTDKNHNVQFYNLEIDHKIDRQGFSLLMNANTNEPEITRLNSEEMEKRYNSSLYNRYGWQNMKGQKPQIGFIIR